MKTCSKSGEIEKSKEYNYREFKKIYLKNLVDELGKDSSKKLKERTDENSQLRESTTEEIDYQMQEDVTIESASLTKQEFDFASSKVTTKEINDVINEIEESNASYGITPEDISSVSRFDSNSQEVLDHSIFNSTDVEGPKLPEINGGQYIGIAGIAGGIFGGVLAVAFAGL
ncbi:hypothetical protein [Wolbachia pipientis]|uniref:hypothetical protein n=1 Tax=Wolbachia pipientis TaxID=955 RepID=UPI0020B854AC|nr:hypothetical protein [Wolbachia pipientis]